MRIVGMALVLLLAACSDGPVLAGGDAAPADGRLFVVRGGRVWVYDDLGYPSQPAAPNIATGFGWLTVSRDGRYLAWTSSRYIDYTQPAIASLYTYDRHTGALRQLLSVNQAAANPSWTADNRLVYLRTDQSGGGGTRLVMSEADGSSLRQLLPDSLTLGRYPEISPDGRRVVWATQEVFPRLAVVDLATGNSTTLTETDSTSSYDLRQPTWSPDGGRIAVVRFDFRYPGPNLSAVRVIGLDGTGLAEFDVPGDASRPAWSPDGQRIAYCRYEGPPSYDTRVRVWRVGSQDDQALTPSPESECGPTWSR